VSDPLLGGIRAMKTNIPMFASTPAIPRNWGSW
jgi:hypothetical protein